METFMGYVLFAVLLGTWWLLCWPYIEWIRVDLNIRKLIKNDDLLWHWAANPDKMPKVLTKYLGVGSDSLVKTAELKNSRSLYGLGGNSLEDYRRMALDQVRRAQRRMTIVSCGAGLPHWNEEIASELRKAYKERHVEIQLVVHRDTFVKNVRLDQNKPIVELVREGAVRLYLLDEMPRSDFRVVDDGKTIYYTPHAPDVTSTDRPYVFVTGTHPGLNVYIRSIRNEVESLLKASKLSTESDLQIAA